MTKINQVLHHQSIEVRKTAHYYHFGNSEDPRRSWLVTHGYGMNADQMLRKFDELDAADAYYCSAEGLSYFYWQDERGEYPVASWMTSRHRLFEIEDYSRYLDQLFRQVLPETSQKCLFGFSQGGTTQWRFINAQKPDFKVFINWAGDIPMDSEYDMDYLAGRTLIYVYGDQDQFISGEAFEKRIAFASDVGLQIKQIRYSGKHRVDRNLLMRILDELDA